MDGNRKMIIYYIGGIIVVGIFASIGITKFIDGLLYDEKKVEKNDRNNNNNTTNNTYNNT